MQMRLSKWKNFKFFFYSNFDPKPLKYVGKDLSSDFKCFGTQLPRKKSFFSHFFNKKNVKFAKNRAPKNGP